MSGASLVLGAGAVKSLTFSRGTVICKFASGGVWFAVFVVVDTCALCKSSGFVVIRVFSLSEEPD